MNSGTKLRQNSPSKTVEPNNNLNLPKEKQIYDYGLNKIMY